jgi:hypothetical protein
MTGFNDIDYDRIQIRIAAVQVGLQVLVEKGGRVAHNGISGPHWDQMNVMSMAETFDKEYEEFIKGGKFRCCHRPVGFIPHLWGSPRIIQARIPRRIPDFRPEDKSGAPEDAGPWDLLEPWVLGEWVQEIIDEDCEHLKLADWFNSLHLEAVDVDMEELIKDETEPLAGEGDNQLEKKDIQVESEYNADHNAEQDIWIFEEFQDN